MTLQQLQYFVTVCKYQNLTKAARELSISQPGISTSIRELETECGFALFERRPNSITLTDQGENFLREAEHLLRAYQKLKKKFEAHCRGKHDSACRCGSDGDKRSVPKITERLPCCPP